VVAAESKPKLAVLDRSGKALCDIRITMRIGLVAMLALSPKTCAMEIRPRPALIDTGHGDAVRVIEQRYLSGRAYRNGEVVCGRVQLTVGRDARLGLAQHERRRYVVARFVERVDPHLRDELAAVARRRGAAARRAAERIAPVEVVFDDKRQRIVVAVLPPQQRGGGPLPELEFHLRELR
jgi:hypothetical protein